MNSLKAAKALLRKEIKLKVAALTENEKQRQSKIVVEKVYILKERNILQCIYVFISVLILFNKDNLPFKINI